MNALEAAAIEIEGKPAETSSDDRTWVSRHLGRKFVGFVIASIMLYIGSVGADVWFFAFCVYCASDVIEKLGLAKLNFAMGRK